MSVIYACIVPHPPIALEEIGRGEENKISKTLSAYRKVCSEIARIAPDTVVITSPHTAMYLDYFHISSGQTATGNFAQFAAADVSMQCSYDTDFIVKLESLAESSCICAGTLGGNDANLDHGVTVPLYFLNKVYKDYKLVRTGISGMDVLAHYRFGKLIAQAAAELGKKTVFIASGDLSHKLKNDGPYGFASEGPEFDKLLTDSVNNGDFLKMLEISPDLADCAGECGWRSFIIMAGALDGKSVKPELLSYEAPFGVGYAVCSFRVTGNSDERHFDVKFEEDEFAKVANMRKSIDAYVNLAMHAAEYYVKNGSCMPVPDGLSAEMVNGKSGVFVSCKKHGMLRGCIGSISPVTDCIANEIIKNARACVSEDPRFMPVSKNELDVLTYSVDVLKTPEPACFKDLDPLKYGIIVTSGSKRGVLLPNLEGVDTSEEQLSIALKKGGIAPDDKFTIERFEVERHS